MAPIDAKQRQIRAVFQARRSYQMWSISTEPFRSLLARLSALRGSGEVVDVEVCAVEYASNRTFEADDDVRGRRPAAGVRTSSSAASTEPATRSPSASGEVDAGHRLAAAWSRARDPPTYFQQYVEHLERNRRARWTKDRSPHRWNHSPHRRNHSPHRRNHSRRSLAPQLSLAETRRIGYLNTR